MAEKLKRLREPLAIVALVAFALQFLATLGAFVAYSGSIGPVSAALSVVNQIGGGLLGLVAAVLVASCAVWGRPTPRARPLALIGAILFGSAVLAGLVTGVIGLFAGNPFGTLARILQLVLPAIAGIVLATIYRGLPVPAAGWAAPGGPPAPADTPHRHPAAPPVSGVYGGWGQRPQPGPAAAPPPPGAHQQHRPQPSFPGQQPPVRPAPRQQQPPAPPAPPQQPATGAGRPQPAPGIGPFPQSGARSQPGEFGSHPRPFGSAPTGNEQPNAGPDQSVEAGDWQPAPQQPPQRLQPSAWQPAVGPHSRSDAPAGADPGLHDRAVREPPAQPEDPAAAADDDQAGDSDHRRPAPPEEDDRGAGRGVPRA